MSKSTFRFSCEELFSWCLVSTEHVTERHRAASTQSISPLPCPAAGPGRPLRAPVRAAAGSPTCCMPRVGRWPLGGGTARNSRALGCSTLERERDSLGRHVAMRGRGATVGRRRTPTLEVSQCRHPGCWRRASRPTSCPPRSRCCSSPHGEGTSSTHTCCSWCSHSRTPHGYRSAAASGCQSRVAPASI